MNFDRSSFKTSEYEPKQSPERMNAYAERYAQEIAACGIREIGHLTDLTSAPTEPGKLCLGLECLDRDLWDFDRAWPLIQKLGAKRVRLQSGWQKTETRKGEYDFGWLDQIVDRLVGDGIEPYLCLCYGNRIYCEDPENHPNLANGGVGHFPIKTAEERAGWIGYVRALAAHFAGRIKYYEIWNEADLSGFARVDLPWADAYMELVKMTAPVIRETVRDAVILSCTANVFRTELLVDRGIARYVDVHSFHGYQFFPEALPPEAVANFIAGLRKKAPSLKFWRGESGCPSYNDPKSAGALSNIAATEPKQAKFLLRHLINDLYNDALDCSSYFHAYDFMHFSKTVRYRYGLIRHEDLTTKPSYDCFQVLTHLFGGSVRAGKESKLSCILQKSARMLSKEEFAALKFYTFQKEDDTIYAYFLPKEINDDVVAKTVHLWLPPDLDAAQNVILDPLTRKLYPLSAADGFLSPVTDYPLLIVNQKMIGSYAKICVETEQPAKQADQTQGNHE